MPVADGRRHPSRPLTALTTLCLILALCPQPTAAADARAKAEDRREAARSSRGNRRRAIAEEADALAAELARLREASVAAAQAAQQNEATISELEDQLAQLTSDEATKSADLRRRSAQSTELLWRCNVWPATRPRRWPSRRTAPIDTMRSAALLGTAIPQIEAKARALRIELAALAALRAEIDEKHGELVAQSDALAKQEMALKSLTARKAVLLGHAAHGAEISAQRLAQLSTEAGDLRELLDRIEAEHLRPNVRSSPSSVGSTASFWPARPSGRRARHRSPRPP